MGRSCSWLGTEILIKKNGGLNSLYGPVLITLFVLINGGYGNEHHKVGVCMSRLIFPRISEHGPFPKQKKGR
jgi:hypothetical protein